MAKTRGVLEGLPLEYDEAVLGELERVYGRRGLRAALEGLLEPPRRYSVRVNVLKADPGEVVDWLRSRGYRAYRDELLWEAVWLPVEGPRRLSDPGCRVFVDKRTAESVMLGASVYAPGVVGVEDCVREGSEVAIVSENGVHVGTGMVVRGFREALQRGRGLVVRLVESLYSVPSLRETMLYREGLIYEQSLSSMLVAHVLGPRPGSVVVDMCAAPGGKTGHIYELVGGKATIIAIDHSVRKVERLRWEMERLGHRGVRVVRMDSRYADLELGKGIADYVLLDPPCTSIGVIPKVYDRKTGRDVANSAGYQRQFLRAALGLLKPGGILVYSTCTMTVSENEENMRYAIEELGFEPLEASPWRGSRGLGEYGWFYQRLHPHVHGTTGYFIARLVKKR